MKVYLIFTLIFLVSFGIGCAEFVEVYVKDDSGNSVSDAEVEVWFLGFTGDDDKKVSGKTDGKGRFKADGKAKYSIHVVAKKSDFYTSDLKGFRKGEDHRVEVVLREKRNPVPLYVREVKLEISESGNRLGFDFSEGDWVAPHGSGKIVDIYIRFSTEFKGMKYTGKRLDLALEMSKRAATVRNEVWSEEVFRIRGGKWDAEVEITFPEGGGMVEEKDDYLAYSEMKFPHSAPEDGYEETFQFKGSTYRQQSDPFVGGHFLRTRVERQGEDVTKANYTKIAGSIEVDARGSLSFLYYFNPIANDRNLEFAPKENLATDQRRSFKP